MTGLKVTKEPKEVSSRKLRVTKEVSLPIPARDSERKEPSVRKAPHHGNRSIKYWKKKILRRYRKRAEKFRDEANTPEQKLAWDIVIEWMNSALRLRFDEERIAWQEGISK